MGIKDGYMQIYSHKDREGGKRAAGNPERVGAPRDGVTLLFFSCFPFSSF